MKRLTTLLVATATAMYFTGCGSSGTDAGNGGSSSSSAGDTEENENYDGTVESAEDLPKCNAKKAEKVYYVEDEDISYTCNYDEDQEVGDWVKNKKKAKKKPVADETVESYDDLDKCNAKKNEKVYYVEDEEVYYTCNYDEDEDEGEWTEIDTDDGDDDGDDDDTDNTDKKSSSSTTITTASCGDMWCGFKPSSTKDIDRVLTGRDAGDGTSGWWWEFNDQNSGGNSRFIWPAAKGNKYSETSFENIVRHCGGMCGDVVLDNGDLDYNFAGIGFNVAGEDVDANVSAWGGICVVYSSDAPIIVEMGLENSADYGEDVPKYKLAVGTNKVKNIQWGDFKQDGWVDEDGEPYPTITGANAAKSLRSLKFKFTGTEGTYEFNVMSIGTYGSCE